MLGNNIRGRRVESYIRKKGRKAGKKERGGEGEGRHDK